jgi:hypothetical protein
MQTLFFYLENLKLKLDKIHIKITSIKSLIGNINLIRYNTVFLLKKRIFFVKGLFLRKI